VFSRTFTNNIKEIIMSDANWDTIKSEEKEQRQEKRKWELFAEFKKAFPLFLKKKRFSSKPLMGILADLDHDCYIRIDKPEKILELVHKGNQQGWNTFLNFIKKEFGPFEDKFFFEDFLPKTHEMKWKIEISISCNKARYDKIMDYLSDMKKTGKERVQLVAAILEESEIISAKKRIDI
jgi:hypothetical protein